jgi:site-specific recombinase XerD
MPPFSRLDTAATLRTGPVHDHVDGFLDSLRLQGYSARSLCSKRLVLADLSRWLKRRRLGLSAFDEKRLDAFLLDRRKRYTTAGGVNRSGVQLLEYLRARGALPPAQVTTPDGLESEYARYLRAERGVAETTVVQYLRWIRPFLAKHAGDDSVWLAALKPSEVRHYVLTQARGASVPLAKCRVTVLRSFLRFLHVQGLTMMDLTPAVPTVANWRLATIPKFIPAEDVRQLLQSCDRGTPNGRRDYAVLVVLARLGLRAGEVARLTLDDIDWEAGELLVRGKGLRDDRIPLPQDVGKALAEYVRRGRPRGASRRLFLGARAPLRGIHRATVSAIVTRAIRRTGLQTPACGAHLLRHSLATDLLRRGGTLAEIGELLRHRSLQTTTLYAKVDFAALREVSPPWPGATP